jgi:hypothetical protein
VQRPLALVFAKLFVAGTSATISAASVAEAIPTSSAQPCILSLGTTSPAVSVSGTSTIAATGCSVRSNGGVTVTGTSSITAASVYAGSTITTTGGATVLAPKHQNSGEIPDPYANDAAVQGALGQLSSCSSCTSVSLSGQTSRTIGPGTYSSISLSGNSSLTMSPGLYVVDGDISVSSGSWITANGVTIVTSGSVSLTGSAVTTISAPAAGATGGAVPGMAIAGPSAKSVSMTGTSNLVVNGAVYFPHAALSFSGTWGNAASPCLELIAQTVTVTGTADLASGGCSSYGARSFGSLNTSVAVLVQ